MKIKKLLLCISIIITVSFSVNINTVYSWWVDPWTLDSIPEYRDGNLYPETYWYNGEYHNGNCTWYCWGRTNHKLGKKLPTNWGDAGSWYNAAMNSGYPVGTTPETNSIIVWAGHVAFVESWDGTNLYISECNWDFRNNGNPHSYNERICNDYYNSPGGVGAFIGFIYLEDRDKENPVLSEAFIDPTSMNGSQYKVCIKASDNVGISKIPVMSWATSNSSNKKEYRATYNSSTGYYEAIIKASDFNGDKGMYKSNVYVYDDAGNGVSKSLSSILMDSKLVTNLGDFEARIVLEQDKNYAITADGIKQNANVMLAEKSNSDESQIWKFIKRSDGKSYEIVNVASNRALDISDAKDENEANVAIHTRNDSDAQTFYIMEYNGGYRIVPKCTADLKAVNLKDNIVKIGQNIDLYSVSRKNNEAQVWIFEDARLTLGDVNQDGNIDMLDYVLILSHVRGTKLLEGESLTIADVNEDGNVDMLDYVLVLSHVRGTKTLS